MTTEARRALARARAVGRSLPAAAAVQSVVGRREDWMEEISREETQVTDGGGYWIGVGRFSLREIVTIPLGTKWEAKLDLNLRI